MTSYPSAGALTLRAIQYVGKPSLAPLPATGDADARRTAEKVAAGHGSRFDHIILRTAAQVELSSLTPED